MSVTDSDRLPTGRAVAATKDTSLPSPHGAKRKYVSNFLASCQAAG